MRIAVLTGGASAERDVALASAGQVVAALRSRGHRVEVVDTVTGTVPEGDEPKLLTASVGTSPPAAGHLAAREGELFLSRLATLPAIRDSEVIFLALHGGRGEDGTLQALLELVAIPYTGSGPLASGVAMDKDISKHLFRTAGIPTADWLMAPVSEAAVADTLGWPVIVKPSKQGSTVGLTLVRQAGALARAVGEAFAHDDEVMIEAFVPGRELTVGVLDGQALAVGEIIPRHELFDYECKYTPGMAEEIFPAQLPARVERRTRELALAAHRALKLGGYSRVDFRLPPEGDPICLETNTLPGLTATSLLPQSARAAGIEFAELCERICLVARGRGKV